MNKTFVSKVVASLPVMLALAAVGVLGFRFSGGSSASSSAAGGGGVGCPISTALGLVADEAPAFQKVAASDPDKRPRAPAWELKDLDGNTVRMADYKGKVVILDFWATWCPPCKKEIPGFINLQKKYGDKGLVVIGVSLDEGGPAVVKPFAQKMGINYPLVMGDQKIAAAFGGIEAIPTTFIIDREGNVVTGHQGYADEATFESEIKPLL